MATSRKESKSVVVTLLIQKGIEAVSEKQFEYKLLRLTQAMERQGWSVNVEDESLEGEWEETEEEEVLHDEP